MKFLKTIFYIFLIAALAAGGYFGWKFYMRAKAPAVDALYILPNNTAIIFAFNDYSKFNEKINSNNLIWQNIRNTYNLEATKTQLDSTLNELRKITDFKSLLDQNKSKLYISYHFSGHNKFETVYSLSLNTIFDEEIIENYLRKKYTLKIINFKDENIYIIGQKGTITKYYLTLLSGVISLSPSQSLAEKIILSAHSISPKTKRMEERMLKMAGKDMEANIFINYSFLYRLLSQYTNGNITKEIKKLRNFSQKAILDVILQKDRLLLSGFSIQSDSFPSFLDSYQGYEPTSIRATEILPATTSFMYYQGAKGLSKLLKSRGKNSFSERNEKKLQEFKARYLVNAEDYFYPWIKSELVFALTKTRSSDQNEGAYAIIEATDIKEAKQALYKLRKTIASIKQISLDTVKTSYRSHEIQQIPFSHLLPMLFGEFFSNLENTFYTSIDNYIIFANSKQALQNIIDNYVIERTLANSVTYQNIIADLSTETHILIYSNLHYLRPNMKKYLSKEGIKLMDHSGLAFENFGAIALEFIGNDEGTYSTLVLHHGGKQEVDEPISWKTALDNPIAQGPYWITNYKTNQKEVVVFDKENLMYRIDENGSIAWAIPVFEQAMSPIYMVDYYQNGKYQYLFNTKHYLHLYDLNGNKVENYPIALPKEASAAMTLVDYDHNKNYRILIPIVDGKVYNFKIDGSQTPGWKYPKMKTAIHQAVQFFKLGTKDFLVICDTSGNVIYANRRGEARMDAELSFTNNTHSIFYVKQKSSPKSIITTDLLGRVISIDAAGRVDKLLLREFSKNHTFYYFDFDGDHYKDYIYLDDNTLFVFNHRNQLVLKKEFEHNIAPKMIGINMKNKDDIKLMLLDLDDQKVILISSTGSVLIGNHYPCNGNFILSEEPTKLPLMRLTTSYDRIISSFLLKP